MPSSGPVRNILKSTGFQRRVLCVGNPTNLLRLQVLPCRHQGQFLKSCNVQDFRRRSHVSSKASTCFHETMYKLCNINDSENASSRAKCSSPAKVKDPSPTSSKKIAQVVWCVEIEILLPLGRRSEPQRVLQAQAYLYHIQNYHYFSDISLDSTPLHKKRLREHGPASCKGSSTTPSPSKLSRIWILFSPQYWCCESLSKKALCTTSMDYINFKKWKCFHKKFLFLYPLIKFQVLKILPKKSWKVTSTFLK